MPDEEDDYLTMALPPSPPSSSTATTSLARARARAKDSERKAHIPSKSALEHDRLLRLERGLRGDPSKADSTDPSIVPSTNKGAAMLARMGYKGGALGRASPSTTSTDQSAPTAASTTSASTSAASRDAEGRLLEPLRINLREGRGGIGHTSTEHAGTKRARETLDREDERDKRVRTETGTYRSRVVSEADERRVEGVWRAAMRTGRTLWEQKSGGEGEMPLLLRPLVKEEKEGEEERQRKVRARDFMHRAEAGQDDEEDDDDRVARGETLESLPGDVLDGDEEDEAQLDEYAALPVIERLDKVLLWLRQEYWYCFWCKSRFDDAQLDGCPGLSEEDHD